MHILPLLLHSARQNDRQQMPALVNCRNSREEFLAHLKDLSPQGMALFGQYCPPQGTFLQITVNLPAVNVGHRGCLEKGGVVVRNGFSDERGVHWAFEFIEPLNITDEVLNPHAFKVPGTSG